VVGREFVHPITVTNTSTREDATRTQLVIRQRAFTQVDGTWKRLGADGMEVSGLDDTCAPGARSAR
jgi:hypothetical protein